MNMKIHEKVTISSQKRLPLEKVISREFCWLFFYLFGGHTQCVQGSLLTLHLRIPPSRVQGIIVLLRVKLGLAVYKARALPTVILLCVHLLGIP